MPQLQNQYHYLLIQIIEIARTNYILHKIISPSSEHFNKITQNDVGYYL